MTMDMQNTFHKDYVVKQYERCRTIELEKYENMLGNKAQILLDQGTVVNDCSLILNKPYLRGYKLIFDVPEKVDEIPVIARLSHEEFKECLLKTDEDHIEKLINFSKSIPGF